MNFVCRRLGSPLPANLAGRSAHVEYVACASFVFGCGEEYVIVPNTRRGMTQAGKCRLPQVIAVRPSDRKPLLVADAAAVGTAESGPVFRASSTWETCRAGQSKQ